MFDLSSMGGVLRDVGRAVQQEVVEGVLRSYLTVILKKLTAQDVATMIRLQMSLIDLLPADLKQQWATEVAGYHRLVEQTTGDMLLKVLEQVRPDVADVILNWPRGRAWFNWQVDKLKEILVRR